jgi:hypothetical protein
VGLIKALRMWLAVNTLFVLKRTDCSAAAMGGKIYIGGGNDGGAQSRVQYLDIRGGASSWTAVGPMVVPRSEFAMVTLFGRLVAMGGYSPVSSRYVNVSFFWFGFATCGFDQGVAYVAFFMISPRANNILLVDSLSMWNHF